MFISLWAERISPHLTPRSQKQQKATKKKKESALKPPTTTITTLLCVGHQKGNRQEVAATGSADREDCSPGEPQDRSSARATLRSGSVAFFCKLIKKQLYFTSCRDNTDMCTMTRNNIFLSSLQWISFCLDISFCLQMLHIVPFCPPFQKTAAKVPSGIWVTHQQTIISV